MLDRIIVIYYSFSKLFDALGVDLGSYFITSYKRHSENLFIT